MALTKLTDIRKSLSVEVEDLKVNGITTFTGSVSIGGTLTYEDVTNIDSVGIITARTGIDVVAGDLVIPDSIIHRGDTNTKIRFPSADTITFETGGSERLRIKSDGTVGIGTDNPAEDLHLYGNSAVVALVESVGANDSRVRIKAPSDRISYLEFADDDADAGEIRYDHTNNYMAFHVNSNQERLRITSDGKVGIGEDSPDQMLHIKAANPFLELEGTAGTTGDTGIFLNANGNHWLLRADNYGSQNLFTIKSGDTSSSTHRFTINASGKVGIGTVNPSAKLEVRDSASTGIIVRSDSTQTTDSNKALRVRNNSDTNTLSVSHKGLLEISRGELGTYLKVGGDDASNGRALTFTSSNTTSNGALHTLNATSGNGAIALATAGTERFRVDSDGNVTKPNNPMFKAMRTSNQSVSSNGWVTIQFNSDTATGCFDVGGNFNTSNHRFTAPVTGYYQFGLNMRVDGGNGDYFRVAFSVNGDTGASNNYPYGMAIYKDSDGFSYYSFSITSLIYLTAGQYVRAEAYSSSDTSWTLQDESIFYGYLVG